MTSKSKSVRGGWIKAFLVVFFLFIFLALLPAVQVLALRWIPPQTTGTALQRWWESPRQEMPHPPWRLRWTSAPNIPRTFFQFVWVAEDQRFFQHQGIDWVEVQAAWRQWRAGGRSRGASTITMQCARTVFLWQGRSWVRKGLEVYYTLWMELLLEKERIFEIYANVVEMGPGVYGIDSAARHWYGRPANRLSRAEMASLVVLLPNPLEWNPRQPSSALRQRQQRLLRRAERAPFPAALEGLGG